MLFNSFEFIFVFLPTTVIIYFLLCGKKYFETAKIWLLFASLFFYGYWNPKYVFLILTSILVNYGLHKLIKKNDDQDKRRRVLVFGVIMNVAVLGYYKYADFFITNYNTISSSEYNLLHIVLPLGISFFTFQQIAFLVDSYKNVVKEIKLIDYSLFVCFFPQLIAGPIVHHGEMMPQFMDIARKKINPENIVKGIFVFNMGLAKKVVLADSFGKIANVGYGNIEFLGTSDSWITSLFYSFQLYFDFSGYSDMAIGIALFFNIIIPNNFWSPYKSLNIKEFWRRWHITLSRFLRDYIYIPLGGNRNGELRTWTNLILTFLIGGIWHGAGWTFVFWGALHGVGLVVHSLYQKLNITLPKVLRLTLTLLFVNIAWVFFRAAHWQDAIHVLENMFFYAKTSGNFKLINQYYDLPIWLIGLFMLFIPNAQEMSERFKQNTYHLVAIVLLVILNITFLNSSMDQEFLYFDF